jgi:hypothetical protein
MQLILKIAIVSIALILAGCGKNVEGTYTSDKDTIAKGIDITLSPNKNAVLAGGIFDKLSGAQACTYSIDGKQVLLKCGNDGFVFDILDDGNLRGNTLPLKGIFKPKKREFFSGTFKPKDGTVLLTFNNDGTGTVKSGQKEAKFKYDLTDENLTVDYGSGEKFKFTKLENGNLQDKDDPKEVLFKQN